MSNVTKLPDRLPTPDESSEAKQLSRALAKFAGSDRVNIKIKSTKNSNDNGDEDLLLPGRYFDMLIDILSEVSQGNAISIIPVKAELTTQQAAAFLNVSRPYLVKLLDNKKIPHHKVGTHRRVYFEDLLNYKSKIDQDRHNTLDKLARLSQELDMGY